MNEVATSTQTRTKKRRQGGAIIQPSSDVLADPLKSLANRDPLRSHGGAPLEPGLRADMEQSFQTDFGGVRIHANQRADASNRSIGSRAFTSGENIHFGAGQFRPDSTTGRQLLGHELTHVVQQREGHAGPQGKSLRVLQDSGLEAAADRAGSIVARGGILSEHGRGGTRTSHAAGNTAGIVQCYDFSGNLPDHIESIEAGRSDRRDNLASVKVRVHDDQFCTGIFDTCRKIRKSLKAKDLEDARARLIDMLEGDNPIQDTSEAGIRLKGVRMDEKYLIGEILFHSKVGTQVDTVKNAQKQRWEELQIVALPNDQKEGFSAALLNLPTVVNLLAYHEQRQGADTQHKRRKGKKYWKKRERAHAMLNIKTAKRRRLSSWKDGGKLDNKDKIETDPVGKKRKLPKNFFRRLKEADRIIKSIVEPERLILANRPKFSVLLKKTRANHQGETVNCSKFSDTTTLVHETGHHLEARVPSELSLEVRHLLKYREGIKLQKIRDDILQQRQDLDPDGDEFKALMKQEQDKEELLYERKNKAKNEYRTAGDFGGTGRYTSRKNGLGTEMVSMTMEYLADPDKILSLINNDPVQAGLVLRQMAPNDYAGLDELRPFDQFLPH